mgnify:CR=1 FL=1
MDAASRRELDALRRRAWGAGGGLDDDPAAQARLAELEAESRAESPGVPPTPEVTAVTAAKARTGDNLGTKYPVTSEQLWTAVQNSLTGAQSPQDALKAAQQAVSSK